MSRSLLRPTTEPETKEEKVNSKDNVVIPTTQLKPEQVRRAYAIVVDDLGISFENVPDMKRAIRKFVNEDVQQGDLVAIVRTGSGSGALQSFTTDKRQLLAAVEKIRYNPYGRGGVSTFDPIRTSLKEDLAGQVDAEGNSSTPEGVDDENAFELRNDDLRRESFEAGTLGALSYVIRGMAELPGRKSVILFSEGFSTINTGGDVANANSMFDNLRAVADYANRSSVVFYTIDPRGLQVPGMAQAQDEIREVVPETSGVSKTPKLDQREQSFRDSQTTLRFLAYETGGVPFVNNNSMSKGIERAMEDQKGYYLIAYEPQEETFDPTRLKYNKIKITVKRPDVDVRTRNGFYGKPDIERPKENLNAGQQVYRALTSPFNANGISLSLNTLFALDDNNDKFIQSLVFIDGKDLEFQKQTDGTLKANFDIVAMTFADSNKPLDEAARNYSITVSEENYRKAIEQGFVYRLNVPIKKSGAYQFRVAVRDSASEKVGTAFQFISVPNLNKNKLTLSSLVLNRYAAKDWALIRSGSGQKAPAPYDNSLDNALRVFKVGDVLQFAYIIYNAKSDTEVTLRTRLIKDGRVILEGQPSKLDRSLSSNQKRMETSGAITIGKNLEAGNYVLQVIVTDRKPNKKGNTVTQWVELEIVD